MSTGLATPLLEERVRFGSGIPAEVNALLQQAAANTDDFAASEQALLRARELGPGQLEVLIALYKLYFYRGRTEQAEAVVLTALEGAAERGHFDADWTRLRSDSTNWQVVDGPARVYLYSLKALCFIRLRQDRPGEAAGLLAALGRLDPDDQVGAGVLQDLADGLEAEST